MGDYDKVIKENIEAILLTLGKRLLGFEIRNPADLPEKLQTTIECEPDFLKKITQEDGSEVILHLEFQTHDETLSRIRKLWQSHALGRRGNRKTDRSHAYNL